MEKHDDLTATFPECLEAARPQGASIVARHTRGLVCLEAGMDGWAPLFRFLQESPIGNNLELLGLYSYCLLQAAYADHEVTVRRNGPVKIALARGDFVFGDRAWSERLHLNHRTLARYMKRLESCSLLVRKSSHGISVFSVVDYGTFKIKDVDTVTRNVTQMTHGSHADDPRVTQSEEGKKARSEEVKKESNPSVAGKPLPKTKRFAPPTPGEVTEYAKTLGFILDGEHFCSYYEARGWKTKAGPIVSWQACVRTWKTNHANRTLPKQPELGPDGWPKPNPLAL